MQTARVRVEARRRNLVGGASGQARIPDWVANVRVDRAVTVTVDRERRHMDAFELDGDERRTAWERAVRRWPRVARYEASAGRPLPVVRLSPRA